MNISEELLGAYLEGNLSGEEMDYVEAQLAADPDLQDLADDVYLYDDGPAATVEDYGYDYDSLDLPDVEVYDVEDLEVYDDEEYEFFEISFDDEPQEVAEADVAYFEDTLPDDAIDFDAPLDFGEIL